jgi:hypothetical protein
MRPRRRLDAYARAVRQARIFARLRDGWAHSDIARDEGLSTQRVRQIVSEALKRQPIDDHETHIRLQIERLGPALKVAGAAFANGDAKAIRPLLMIFDQLARYHELARARMAERVEQLAAPPGAAGVEPGRAPSRRRKSAQNARSPVDTVMAAEPPAFANQAPSDAGNFLGFVRCKPLKMNN